MFLVADSEIISVVNDPASVSKEEAAPVLVDEITPKESVPAIKQDPYANEKEDFPNIKQDPYAKEEKPVLPLKQDPYAKMDSFVSAIKEDAPVVTKEGSTREFLAPAFHYVPAKGKTKASTNVVLLYKGTLG